MRAAIVLALACAVAGCASPATPSPAQVRQERLRSWQQQCDERGFVRGTSDFDACLRGYEREAAGPPIR
ncbi:MAG: hypothetical protein IT518_15765 [Burkholderiales bacterium]|nr:hypothetical protein [Burkholderiales bacterium]